MNKKIIMTGGGSAGHVTPNLAIIPGLKNLGYDIVYIGTKDGIERKIIEDAGIKYYAISSGKLRRYFDIKNFSDPFKVLKGIGEAKEIIKREKPNIIFSKGGFVSVPVVMAGHRCKVPTLAHESDITPGLANKISAPFCTKICVTFPESINNLKKNKAVLTGTPIRRELFEGSRLLGLAKCRFDGKKPVLLIIGGSLGSKVINDTVRKNVKVLSEAFDIIHICGKNNIDENLMNITNYIQYEYVSEELPNLMNAADLVLSRAGANVIFELLALKKPNILIPLSKKSSRGDQILNAASFEKNGYSMVIQEENLNEINIAEKLKELQLNKNNYIKAMNKSQIKDGTQNIINEIIKYSK